MLTEDTPNRQAFFRRLWVPIYNALRRECDISYGYQGVKVPPRLKEPNSENLVRISVEEQDFMTDWFERCFSIEKKPEEGVIVLTPRLSHYGLSAMEPVVVWRAGQFAGLNTPNTTLLEWGGARVEITPLREDRWGSHVYECEPATKKFSACDTKRKMVGDVSIRAPNDGGALSDVGRIIPNTSFESPSPSPSR